MNTGVVPSITRHRGRAPRTARRIAPPAVLAYPNGNAAATVVARFAHDRDHPPPSTQATRKALQT